MSDIKDIFKPALSQLALALVPHLAEELITAVAAHFAQTKPVETEKQSVADLAAADAAREDAASAPETTDTKPAGGRRKRGAGATADTNADASGTKDEPTSTTDTAPAGGRRRRNKPADDTTTSAKEEPALIADNTEQAAMRAQLIVDLGDLCDIEEAQEPVAVALSAAGAATIDQVPSAKLAAVAEVVNALIAEHFDQE